MIRRTVVWVTDAEAELGEIWLASNDRNRVTAASNKIDRVLGHDANHAGVALSEELKALDEPPLRVLFEILERDRIVRVLKVKQFAGR